MRIQWMGTMPGMGAGQGVMPPLAKDTAWKATLAGLIAYMAWQGIAMITAGRFLIGRNGNRCIVGPECGLLADTGDLFAGLVAGATLLVSLAILPWLYRLFKAVRSGQLWTPMVTNLVGKITAIGGLFGFLIGGWVWLLIGIWLSYFGKRMRMDPGTGQQPNSRPPRPPQPTVIDAERV